MSLPDQAISVVHRSDSSGTTYIFTDYLSTVSSTWALRAGRSKAPTPWPAGLGVSGNVGVGKQVKATSGSIGYVELKFALDNGLQYARIRNRAGNYVAPDGGSVLAAANEFPGVTASSFSIVDAPGATSYPICGYTWGLVRAYHANTGKGVGADPAVPLADHSGPELHHRPALRAAAAGGAAALRGHPG